MITIDFKTLKEIQEKLKPIEMMLDESNQYLKAVKAVFNSGLPNDAGLHIVTARQCGFTHFQKALKESEGYIVIDDIEKEDPDMIRVKAMEKDVNAFIAMYFPRYLDNSFSMSYIETLKRKRAAVKLVLGVKKRYIKAPSIKTCSALEYFKLHYLGTWIT
ncbi:hypothetical protein [Flavobacterium gelatinilyticum]|uniref:hypothetical protein n=1 Tax=Flavobacterium gelatinilyticum TaxID=3003260 RepID=UPI00247FFA3F|nr:hypothetical protein [Flavobacterium gelatinilyticum]